MTEKTKVLMHACCAICSGYPISLLREMGYEPVAYYFNPNIYPTLEYQKRLDALRKLCNELKCELIEENYERELYSEVMTGYENYKEGSSRCKRCFELRLLKTAQKAKELGIEYYTSTLSVSPHKNYNLIKQIGDFFSEYFNINFIDANFKKQDGFLKTMKIAKSLDLYRQNYCGCEISLQCNQAESSEKINP